MPTTTRWGIVALAITAGIIAAMQIGKLPPAVGALRVELSLGLVAAGWIISCFNAVSALFGAVAGVAGDHMGQRRTLLLGLGLLALGGAAGALAEDGRWLLLTRLLEGVGFVAVVVSAPSLIAAVTRPPDRNTAIAAWGTYMPAGMALMLLAAPPLLGALGWRGVWLVNAGLIVAFLLVFAVVSRGSGAAPAQKRNLRDVRQALVKPGPWLLAACFTSYSLQWFAMMAWLPTLLTEQAALGVGAASLITALIVACNVPGNLLGGRLLKRGLPRWLLIAFASASLGLLALGVFAAAVPVGWKIILAALFATLGGLIPASVLAGVPRHASSAAQIGIANGIVVQGSNLGSLFGPPALAMLVTALGGWQRSGWLLLGSGLVGVGLALLLRKLEQRADS